MKTNLLADKYSSGSGSWLTSAMPSRLPFPDKPGRSHEAGESRAFSGWANRAASHFLARVLELKLPVYHLLPKDMTAAAIIGNSAV